MPRPIAHLFCLSHGHQGNQPRSWAFSLMLTPKSCVKILHFLFSSLPLAEYILQSTPRASSRPTCHSLQSIVPPLLCLQKHHKHLICWIGRFGCKRRKLSPERWKNVCKSLEVREKKQEEVNRKLKKIQTAGCRHQVGIEIKLGRWEG